MSPAHQLALVPATGSRGPARAAPCPDTDRVSAARRDVGSVLLQLQRSYGNRYVQRLVDQGQGPARMGIPDGIKAALERRAGVDLSAVRVHYNSPRPARLGALAYTQGSEIHLAPGQERHLAHEAWHVVQQRQGRVRATRTKAGVPLNDDARLEREADSLGRARGAAPPLATRPQAEASQSGDPRPSYPAPVQLTADLVDRRLLKYRQKKDISEAVLQRLLVVFAEWEKLQKEADKTPGKFPAGWYRRQAVGTITKEVIEALNADNEITPAIRRKLVKAWNKGAEEEDLVTFRAPPPAKDVVFEESGEPPLWTPLSPLAETYQGGFELTETLDLGGESPPEKESKEKGESEGGEPPKKKQRKTKTLRTGTGKEQKEYAVPVADNAQEAALLIRTFAKQEKAITGGFKIIWGGGMFHKSAHQDIVYDLIGETGTGSYSLEGGIPSWTDILQQVPREYLENPVRFLRTVQAALRGPAPDEPEIALVAGAMICDVKHGVTEWVQLLSELYPMLPALKVLLKPGDLQGLFLKWYEYSARGGRDLRGRVHRSSYRDREEGKGGRVKTREWEKATLIPSRGGFHFMGAIAPSIVPLEVQAWKLVFDYVGDPAKLWGLAMTNRYFYNVIAESFRTSRKLDPKEQ